MQIIFCIDFLIYIVQSVKDRILLCLNAKWGLWFISAAYFMAILKSLLMLRVC